MSVASEILSEKRAFGGIKLEIGRRTWLYPGEHLHQCFGSLAPWHAVEQYAVRPQFKMEDVVAGRKRIRFMVAQASKALDNVGAHRTNQ